MEADRPDFTILDLRLSDLLALATFSLCMSSMFPVRISNTTCSVDTFASHSRIF